MDKFLIVNADDFGLDEDVNLGILEAYRAGTVMSASLMVNMPAAEAAADMARRAPQLEIGVHANITEGRCLSAPQELRGLVNDDGTFTFDTADIPGSIRRLRTEVELDESLPSRISVEVRRQIERLRNLGLKVVHLNAHHYWPLLHPRLYACYVHAAAIAGVPFRGFCDPMVRLIGTPAAEIAEMGATMRSARVQSPSVSLSNPLDGVEGGERSIERHRELIGNKLAAFAASPDVSAVELITHPVARAAREADVYGWARRLESALVHSVEFRRSVERLGYVLGGYSVLARNHH